MAGVLGLKNMVMETRGDHLWVPTTADSYKHFQFVENTYGSNDRLETLFVTLRPDATATNILDVEVISEVMRLHDLVTSEVQYPPAESEEHATFQSAPIHFSDICVKKNPELIGDAHSLDNCRFLNFLTLWNYDVDTLLNMTDPAVGGSYETGISLRISTLNVQMPIDSIMGTVGTSPVNEETVEDAATRALYEKSGIDERVDSALAAVIAYPVSNDDEEGAMKWESSFIDAVVEEGFVQIDVQRVSERSISDELTRLVQVDSGLFAMAIFTIMVYLAVTFGKRDKVESRFLLSWSILPMMLFSVIFSFGTTACILPLNTICAMVPFISVGVAVDDMIVIADFFDKTTEPDVESRMESAMSHAGAAIFLTSLTAVIAFLSGTFVSMPGVATFCMVAAMAFLWNFVLNMTFFPALLVLDTRRVAARRHFLCPCATVAEAKVEPADARKPYNPFAPDLMVVGESPLDRWIHNTGAPLLAETTTKCVFAVVLVGFLFVCATAAPSMVIGMTTRDVIPDDSYVHNALDVLDRFFVGKQSRTVSIHVQKLDWSDPDQRRKVCTTSCGLEEEDGASSDDSLFEWFVAQDYTAGAVGQSAPTWVVAYESWRIDSEGYDYSAAPGAFHDRLDEFLALTDYTFASPVDIGFSIPSGFAMTPVQYAPDVVCAAGGCSAGVETSRFNIWQVSPTETKVLFQIHTSIQKQFAALGIDGFGFNKLFLYGALDDMIPSMTVMNLAVALLVVTACVFLLLDGPTSVAVAICVVMIDVDLLGTMVLSGTQLNATSFTCLVMSVGLCVDYCVHIGHAIMHSKGDGNTRLLSGMDMMGSSVVKGGLTTFLGVMVLAFSSSIAFRAFFQLLFGTVVYGVVHGLIFLPILLSLRTYPDPKEENKYDMAALKSRMSMRRISTRISSNQGALQLSQVAEEQPGKKQMPNSSIAAEG